MSLRFVTHVAGAAVLALLSAGCGGPPQFQPANRELLRGLQTAVSAKKSEWIDAAETKILTGRRAGTVSDTEFGAMNDVIRKARAGNWDAAKQAVFALVDGQRPTAEEMENLRTGTRHSGG